MPMGYQPPKFQYFDNKGNPKQHVAHFVETCNNAETYGDHLVKQFIRSLKGNTFDWYADLEADSIDGWEQLETKEKQEVRKGGKPFSKAPSKESMVMNITPFKLKSTTKDSIGPKNIIPYKKPQRKLTLKEMQARQYPFLNYDVSEIFDDLLETNLINLPEMKRLEETKWKDDLKYCKYHHLVEHAIQDYFVFKDKVM
ncbi:UNVERIFIED_CONTAM: hypothetical protein Sradi_3850100 [Sesamum radiatum]|uniref:Ty3-gypsy retrotransposon protein n=1 Tax=Sesamum radiatum TaxID=300843 RepID=A0AAW2Q1S3_SESRA